MILYHCICYFCWNIACQCLTFKPYFCLNLTYPLFLARIDEQKVKYKKVEYPSKIEELFLFLSLLISSSLFSFILEVGVSRKDLGWNKSTLKNHWCFVFRENHFEEHLASVWRSIIHFFNDLELMKWLAKLFVNTFDRIFHDIINYNEDLSIVNHLKLCTPRPGGRPFRYSTQYLINFLRVLQFLFFSSASSKASPWLVL